MSMVYCFNTIITNNNNNNNNYYYLDARSVFFPPNYTLFGAKYYW